MTLLGMARKRSTTSTLSLVAEPSALMRKKLKNFAMISSVLVSG